MSAIPLAIPTEASISVDWFNQCFASLGLQTQVVGFTAKQIGTGQIGKCIRYSFDLKNVEAQTPDVPLSVIGKYPAGAFLSAAARSVADQNAQVLLC